MYCYNSKKINKNSSLCISIKNCQTYGCIKWSNHLYDYYINTCVVLWLWLCRLPFIVEPPVFIALPCKISSHSFSYYFTIICGVVCLACRNVLSYTAEEDSNANKWVLLLQFLFLSFTQTNNRQEHAPRNHDWYSHSLRMLHHGQCGILCRPVKSRAPLIRSNGIGMNGNFLLCMDCIYCCDLSLQCVLFLIVTVV